MPEDYFSLWSSGSADAELSWVSSALLSGPHPRACPFSWVLQTPDLSQRTAGRSPSLVLLYVHMWSLPHWLPQHGFAGKLEGGGWRCWTSSLLAEGDVLSWRGHAVLFPLSSPFAGWLSLFSLCPYFLLLWRDIFHCVHSKMHQCPSGPVCTAVRITMLITAALCLAGRAALGGEDHKASRGSRAPRWVLELLVEWCIEKDGITLLIKRSIGLWELRWWAWWSWINASFVVSNVLGSSLDGKWLVFVLCLLQPCHFLLSKMHLNFTPKRLLRLLETSPCPDFILNPMDCSCWLRPCSAAHVEGRL